MSDPAPSSATVKSPLNRLILLGFICQGLSWDDWLLPLVNIALWTACLNLRKRTRGVGQAGDILGMIIGCTLGYVMAIPLGASKHFFIGHGLTLLQASRLTRQLDRRETIFSLIVALGQIGVACTVILDYRFILILFATLILVPKALVEIERERLAAPRGIIRPPIRLTWKAGITLFVVLIVFFFGTPRGLMGGALRAPTIGGGTNNMLDDMLDPTFGGRANSGQILMQVDGDHVGYMRMFSLTLFTDGVWKREPAPQRYIVPGPADEMPTNLLHRSVRVKNATYLRKTLPYDGQIAALTGNFFRGPTINDNAVIESRSVWNAANNNYDYWIHPRNRPAPLSGRRQRLLRRHPPLSPTVNDWLNERTADATNQLDAARKLESWFVDNFDYELGAPNLNRLNALEQFLLQEKRGHCERFASAMALLLRAKGIPTRVVVGFIPGAQNWLSGWYDIRFKDAHAWTEAWFPEHGWIFLDATPRADLEISRFNIAEFLDALDVIWYSNFVNFSAGDQQSFITVSTQAIKTATAVTRTHLTKIILILIALALAYTWRRRQPNGPAEPDKDERQRQIEYAEDCYGQMLRLLAENGLTKKASQTPIEFLQTLQSIRSEALAAVRPLTQTFCSLRYGSFTSIDTASMDRDLDQLRKVSQAGRIREPGE